MIAILGGLGAAAAWAVATLCSSRSSRQIGPNVVVAWVMLIGLLITAPLAVADGVPARLHSSWGWLVLSGTGSVAGLMLTYRALSLGQVALVAPVVSTEGAIAAVIAVLAGESLGPAVAATLVLIVAGVCLSSIPAAESVTHGEAPARADHARSVALAAMAACVFGASLYAAGRAGASLPSAWVVLPARLVGVTVLALPLAIRGELRLTRRSLPLVAVSGVCEVLGFFSYTGGARDGVAIAAVLSSQFATLAALAAYALFHERLTRLQFAGVCTVIAGVAALSAIHG